MSTWNPKWLILIQNGFQNSNSNCNTINTLSMGSSTSSRGNSLKTDCALNWSAFPWSVCNDFRIKWGKTTKWKSREFVGEWDRDKTQSGEKYACALSFLPAHGLLGSCSVGSLGRRLLSALLQEKIVPIENPKLLFGPKLFWGNFLWWLNFKFSITLLVWFLKCFF